jgi:hypothetical protein
MVPEWNKHLSLANALRFPRRETRAEIMETRLGAMNSRPQLVKTIEVTSSGRELSSPRFHGQAFFR